MSATSPEEFAADFGFDPGTPHPARVDNYLLGGKDNYAADRDLAHEMMDLLPELRRMARASRRFLLRAVRVQVAECGVRQFLDLGCGYPTAVNAHEVAQDSDPSARVAYVDDDLSVAAHVRALLPTSTPAGKAAFVLADVRKPAELIDDPELRAVLDVHEPVGVLLTSILHCFRDEVAHEIVSTLLGRLPAGSCVTISHPTADFARSRIEAAAGIAEKAGLTYLPRAREQVLEFFAGLELLDPGLVPLPAWRPALPDLPERGAHYWAGVARKPDGMPG